MTPDLCRQYETAFEYARHPGNLATDYDRLSPDERARLADWIAWAYRPARRRLNETSYGMKHRFENHRGPDGGFYISNGQFKGAMLAAGHAPVDRYELNWEFRVALRQPRNLYAEP